MIPTRNKTTADITTQSIIMPSNISDVLASTIKEKSLIKPFSLVGSEWREGATQFAVINPATGQGIVRMADVGKKIQDRL